MNDGLSRKRKIRNKTKGKWPKGVSYTEAIMDAYGNKRKARTAEIIARLKK
jgi:hypothetical protein